MSNKRDLLPLLFLKERQERVSLYLNQRAIRAKWADHSFHFFEHQSFALFKSWLFSFRREIYFTLCFDKKKELFTLSKKATRVNRSCRSLKKRQKHSLFTLFQKEWKEWFTLLQREKEFLALFCQKNERFAQKTKVRIPNPALCHFPPPPTQLYPWILSQSCPHSAPPSPRGKKGEKLKLLRIIY